MSLPTKDPALADHLAWLGYVQPDGLVVSAPALVDAQAIIDRAQLGELQRRFAEHVSDLPIAEGDTAETQPGIKNLQRLVTEFLGWQYELLVGVDPSRQLPESLYISLPEFQETLRPSFAVWRKEYVTLRLGGGSDHETVRPRDGGTESQSLPVSKSQSPFLLLVQSHPATVDLDKPIAASDRNWHASPSKKFERLLRETGVSIGLLTNGTQFRLIYAPPKENSGSLTFPVGAMTEVSGRLILGAFQLLLGSWTLFNAPSEVRLPALLQRSRDYQASVSEILAEQVLHALYELLRGLEAADDRAQGKLLRELAAKSPHEIYGGLVAVLLRLVFTLFAEDRGLLPASGLYVRNYSVHGLFERLRADAERYPDTMDHRFGAWAQLLALFRVIHGGCRHPELNMPAHAGHLFDPDHYPFLEGRASRTAPIAALPLVSDGVIYRILEKLCILEGERVSYRTLDVEEIGSVYQTIMGFDVETAEGTAVALKGKRKKGGVPAAPVICLEQLLAAPAKDRGKWLKENADTELNGEADKNLKAATTVDDLLVALEKRIDRSATPGPVAKGGLVLQPGDERRRSGSHYTPRSFTEPIVRKTLEPILQRLVNGERRTVSGGETSNAYDDSILSRPQGLAGRAVPGQTGLSADARAALGGEVRPHLPDAPGGGINPVEHRGGVGAPLPVGVHPVSPDSQRQSGRVGDSVGPQPGPPVRGGGEGESHPAGMPQSGSSNPGFGTQHQAEVTVAPSSAPVHRSPVAVHQAPTPEAILSLKICDIAVGSAAFLVETCRQLADQLVKAWRVHGGRPALPPDETEGLLAMRLIAQRCLYGVDRNPMAVDLAKLSLWLATLAKDHPFTFLDHAIRCGDSLVGLTRRQIETFTWKTGFTTGQLWEQEVRKRTKDALHERQNLLGLGDDYGMPQLKREKLAKADELLDLVRFIGDAAVAAFFAADKDKAREAKRAELAERIADYLGKGDVRLRPTAEVRALRGEAVNSKKRTVNGGAPSPTVYCSPVAAHPVLPFHWEIEFPEVFDRENPGFDGIVGNPPFAGKNTLINSNHDCYPDWLKEIHQESHGNADLVAHFFRRAFDLLRHDGCFGLIATNTIGQGDTRASGLRWICKNGGTVYSAHKRYKWPGQAAVVVSVVWVARGSLQGPYDLDGKLVPIITAYLFHAGGSENPAVLVSSSGKSFQGSIVLGMGFTFDDTDLNGVASPLALMHDLVAKEPRNAERIFPYIGGEEVNDSPTHAFHRYVIDFFDRTLEEASNWPDLVGIIRQRVKPERDVQKRDALRERWWQYAEKRPGLYRAIAGLENVLVCLRVSQTLAFTFLRSNAVFANTLNVFALSGFPSFAMLQSRSHEVWARFLSSTFKDDQAYHPSDCFETFPFPDGFETNTALEAAGREYYEFRAALMQDLWLGLTEIYNLFHSPDGEALARLETLYRKRAASSEWRAVEKVPADRSPLTAYRSPSAALDGIRRLRTLHAAMDAAVLTAYGWTDLIPKCTCEFLLDYEEEEEESSGERRAASGEGAGRKRKKPWRYRWPDEVRDEVLARLLKLNAERAEEEKIAGQAAAASAHSKPKKPRAKKSGAAPAQGNLLSASQDDLFG